MKVREFYSCLGMEKVRCLYSALKLIAFPRILGISLVRCVLGKVGLVGANL